LRWAVAAAVNLPRLLRAPHNILRGYGAVDEAIQFFQANSITFYNFSIIF
jgi:hypothetical protein